MTLVKKLFSRRWIGGTLIVLVAMGLFARLGVWQLDRLAQRRTDNEQLQAVLDAPPLDLAEPLPADPDALANRLAAVTGQYAFGNERVLLLQSWQGQPGVQLLTPLLIEGGENTAVLVNRGWVPQAEYEAGELARYQTETGTLTVSGYLALSQASRTENSATAQEIYRIDLETIEAELPYDLLPVYLIAAPGVDVELDPPLRAARQEELSEGPHLSYAWQWFIFCALTGTLYLGFVWRSERERPSSPKTNDEQSN